MRASWIVLLLTLCAGLVTGCNCPTEDAERNQRLARANILCDVEQTTDRKTLICYWCNGTISAYELHPGTIVQYNIGYKHYPVVDFRGRLLSFEIFPPQELTDAQAAD